MVAPSLGAGAVLCWARALVEFGATMAGLTLLADRIRLDLDGLPPALVDVTPAAVAELSLDPVSQVWLTVKATDLEVYPHNGAQAG